MKKLFPTFFALLFLIACSNDDDNNNETTEASIVGTFVLTELNSAFNDDYNEDGTIDDNLLVELPCFDSNVTFRADGTYTSTSDAILIEVNNNSQTATCDGPFTSTGTYIVEGNTLTINEETTTDPDGVAITVDSGTFVVTETTFTLTASSPFGTVVFVYTRQ